MTKPVRRKDRLLERAATMALLESGEYGLLSTLGTDQRSLLAGAFSLEEPNNLSPGEKCQNDQDGYDNDVEQREMRVILCDDLQTQHIREH